MNCPHCGQLLTATAVSCIHCGNPTSPQPTNLVSTTPSPTTITNSAPTTIEPSNTLDATAPNAVPSSSLSTLNQPSVASPQSPLSVISSAPGQSNTLQYATILERFFGMLIDILPSIVISAVSALLFPPVSTIILYWLYYTLTTNSKWQGTIGKRVVGTKVIGLEGQKVGFWRITLRYFAFVFTTVLTIGFGLLVPLFTKKRQGLHDLIAHTVVVKSR